MLVIEPSTTAGKELEGASVTDLLSVGLVVGFFAVTWGLVEVFDRLKG